MLRTFGAAVAAVALLCAPAGANCWNETEAAAAGVRELQSLLMVAALRCQISRHDMTADYNRFLLANRATIQSMNERLKTHFIAAAGPVGGQTAYDAFATTLANGHGAEASGAGDCDAMAALAREAALMAGSEEGLLLLAARQGLAVMLPGGSCAAAPTAPGTAAAVTIAIAMAPSPAPVAIPPAPAPAEPAAAPAVEAPLPSIFPTMPILKVASLVP